MKWFAALLIAIALCIPAVHGNNAHKMDDLESKMMHKRYQRFNTERTPLDTLFSMNNERKEDMQERITDMMKQARLHAEAKRKVEKEMKRVRGARA
jgi:hypothetical protein